MDRKDVEHLFELAKIEATPHELERIPKELESILEYVSMLKDAPLGNLAPLLSLAPKANIFREDVPNEPQFGGREQFPETENNYLKTKNVFGND